MKLLLIPLLGLLLFALLPAPSPAPSAALPRPDDDFVDCHASNPELPAAPASRDPDRGHYLTRAFSDGSREALADLADEDRDDVTIRILFVHTGSENEELTLATADAITWTNKVFATSLAPEVSSGVQSVQFLSAGCVAIGSAPGFEESLSMSELLTVLACDCPGNPVHVERDQHQADLVCLITGSSGSTTPAGIAFVYEPRPNPDRFGFLVVTADAITNPRSLTLSHELGHLLGCLHSTSAENCDSLDGAHPHSFRLETSTGRKKEYGTLMAGQEAVPCFSSPDLMHDGIEPAEILLLPITPATVTTPQELRLGISLIGDCGGSDNVSVIRRNAISVALYRGTAH